MSLLLNSYFPSVSELTDEQLRESRSVLEGVVRVKYPEQDTRPGSVFGDLHLNPAAVTAASCSEAVRRLVSDLTLENVAGGLVYNPDVVREYLKNYVPTGGSGLMSYGVIRLVFSGDVTALFGDDGFFEFTSGMYFSPGGDVKFVPRVFDEGSIRIYPVGSYLGGFEGSNSYALSRTSSTRYFVDIPVIGDSIVAVLEGASMAPSVVVPLLESITVLGDFFVPALLTESLRTQARRAVIGFNAASFNTRRGVVKAVNDEFPDVSYVSTVVTGDVEMCRSVVGLVDLPSCDVHVRTPLYGSTVREVVPLTYDSVAGVFYGEFHPAHVPLRIKSMRVAAGATGNNVDFTSYLIPRNPEMLGVSSAFGRLADYALRVPMVFSSNGDPLIPFNNEGVTPLQYFEVTYLADIGFNSVRAFLESDGNRPVGVSEHVRTAIPVFVEDIELRYTPEAGRVLDTNRVTEETALHFNKSTPEFPFSPSQVIESAFFAGARSVPVLNVTTRRYSAPTSHYLPNGTTITPANLVPAEENEVSSYVELNDFDVPWAAPVEECAVVGRKNLGFLVDDSTTYRYYRI
jgi:hypothetical protein